METVHVNDILDEIYSDYNLEFSRKIDSMNKKDFERQSYYRGLNRLEVKEKEEIQIYESILSEKLGIGIAAARMVLFRIGVLLRSTDE